MADFALRAKLKRQLPFHHVLILGYPIRACALKSFVHFLATYFPRLMIGKHAWQALILDMIHYVLLLQHPSDLEEVTSRESTIHPPNPCQLTTCTFLPSSRNCRPSSVIHLTVMHLTHRWPPNSLCAPRAHRQLQRLQFVYK